MSDIAYPRPENVRGRYGRWVTADMFHISERIRELDGGDRLYIQHLDPPAEYNPGDFRNFAIVEIVPGMLPPERLVTAVAALDGRVIEHLQYLLRVPFKVRFAEAEKLEKKRQDDELAAELDKALEGWGWDMRKQLAHDGFITHTGKSYAKRGVHATTAETPWRALSHS